MELAANVLKISLLVLMLLNVLLTVQFRTVPLAIHFLLVLPVIMVTSYLLTFLLVSSDAIFFIAQLV
jgi:hypothetical protein